MTKWIPVTQKLPLMHVEIFDGWDEPCTYRISDPVLIFAEEGILVVARATEDRGEVIWVEEDGTEYSATPWMPLPEPPQKEDA